MRVVSEGVTIIAERKLVKVAVVVEGCSEGGLCLICPFFAHAVERGPNQPKDVVYCKKEA